MTDAPPQNPSSGQPFSSQDVAQPARTADPRRWKALAVLLLVQFMLILDVSAVNIALPNIQSDLEISRSGLTWVVDSYVLVAGSLLLLGGRLGDLLGRRRVFLIGAAVFGVSSLTCALAQGQSTLIASRAAQGLGEALAAPAALGLIALLFTDRKERTKAIGLFGGISGLAGTAGPIVSGALVEYASWRWIFLVNIPVAVFAIVVLPRLVKADKARPAGERTRLDLPGAALSTLGVAGIVFGLIEAATYDWGSARVLGPLLGGIVLIGAFVAFESRTAQPLLPLSFLRERTRVAANATTLVFASVFFTQFFITTLFLQQVLGFGPLRAGLAYLPFGVAIGIGIGIATSLLPKLGLRPVLLTGLLTTAVGVLLYTRISADGSYVGDVLPGMVVVALGSGLTLPTLQNAAVYRVDESNAGLAAGLQQAVQQIGGAIGLALLITIALRSADDSAASAAVAQTEGYVLAFQLGLGLLLLATVLAAVLVPGSRSTTDEDVPASA